MKLTDKVCIACEGGVEPLNEEEARKLLSEVSSWTLSPDFKKITKEFIFRDFVRAMAFVDEVADIAEVEGHHPDIHISYNKVILELSTHSIGGLSENDFIVAAKVDELIKFHL